METVHTKKEPARRNALLDCLKGFAIIMVVVGHAIQYTIGPGYEANPLIRLIFSFDMPLFMFISGYLGFENTDKSAGKLFQKFRSLIIPFFAWFIIYFAWLFFMARKSGMPTPDFAASLTMLIKSPDTGLWFLWVLFLNHLVLYIARHIDARREELYALLILIVVNVCWRCFNMDYLGIGLLRWHLLFYLMGYVINKHMPQLGTLFKRAGLVSCIVFPFLLMFWKPPGNPTFYNALNEVSRLNAIICLLYNYLVAVTAILAVYTYFKWLIAVASFIKKPLVYLGKLTIEIYSAHALFFSLVGDLSGSPLWLQVLAKTCAGLLCSLLLQYAVKRSGVLSMILYGRK